MNTQHRSPLSSLLLQLRPALGYALVFSVFVNLMLLGPTVYMLQVFDRVLSSRSEATLGMLTLGVAITLIAMSLVDAARARVLIELGKQLDKLLGEKVLRRVVRQSSSPTPTGPVTGLRDVATLRTFLSGPNVIALFDAPWMLIFVGVIYLFHPAMGILALCGALLLILLALISERMNRAALERLASSSRQGSQFIDQGVRNADVLNGMGITSAFVARWNRLNTSTLDLMQGSSNRASTYLAVTKFLRQSIQVGMMGLGAWLVLDNNVTPGIMIAATILFGRAMAPVEAVIGNWGGLVAARNAWARLNKLLPAPGNSSERTPLPEPKGHLELERISLPGAHPDCPILRYVELNLPAGKSLGILGPSGAGKSSLAKIMAGIWTPGSGKVRIDGAEMSHWDMDQLGPYLGYLPQDVELFPGTVAENIARFQADAGKEVIQAAHLAHAYSMILKLPQGFDTRLGEGGIRLSAGQAQRIGLARALFRRPKIIVLDEPNANLDIEGEQALLNALAEMKKQESTIIMVTHKPSLVSSLDYLLVLRDGRMELMGPRDQVMARLSGTAPCAEFASPPGVSA